VIGVDRRILIADEGMWITDGNGYYKRVALGNWDSVDNYTMVTDAEYNARMTTETEDV
jgi:hypothetical protein